MRNKSKQQPKTIKVSTPELKITEEHNEDHEILMNLMQQTTTSQTNSSKISKSPRKKHDEHYKRNTVIPRKKRRRKLKIIRKGKHVESEMPQQTKIRNRPNHVKLYWDKRIEMAPKNIMSEAHFREEYKKTTPYPTRKGEGERYKPTTAEPEHKKTPQHDKNINTRRSKYKQ